jgi:hypothetical protein
MSALAAFLSRRRGGRPGHWTDVAPDAYLALGLVLILSLKHK